MSGRYGNQMRYQTVNPVSLQLTPRAMQLLAGKKVANAVDHVLYDTKRFKAGAAVPTQAITFFTSGFGQQDFIVNAPSEGYAKPRADTNLQEGNRLPAGQYLVVDSLQAFVTFTGDTDTTYASSGAGTEQPTAPAAGATISGNNQMSAILQQSYIEFWFGESKYEDGPLWRFPSEFGISGFAGSGQSANATAIVGSESIYNNGMGYARPLAIQREIPNLVNIHADLYFTQGFTPVRNFAITVCMAGILYKPVQ